MKRPCSDCGRMLVIGKRARRRFRGWVLRCDPCQAAWVAGIQVDEGTTYARVSMVLTGHPAERHYTGGTLLLPEAWTAEEWASWVAWWQRAVGAA